MIASATVLSPSLWFQDLLASMNSSSQVAGAGSLPVPNRVLDKLDLHEKPVAASDENVSSCTTCFSLKF